MPRIFQIIMRVKIYHGNDNYHFMVIVIVMEVLIENIQYTIQTID